MPINDFERDILMEADGRPRPVTEGGYKTVAYIAWEDHVTHTIEMGRVRWVHEETDQGAGIVASASPFPGAWTRVPEADIRNVRHPEAML